MCQERKFSCNYYFVRAQKMSELLPEYSLRFFESHISRLLRKVSYGKISNIISQENSVINVPSTSPIYYYVYIYAREVVFTLIVLI